MVVKASQRHFEDEEEHDEEVVLVAVTYVGDHQLYTDNAVRTQGYWPSYGGFTRGVTEVAFVPDRGLGYYENRADFDVEYSKKAIAGALLDRNYLAPDIFKSGAGGGEVKRRVLDRLGIESLQTTTDGIREQLKDVAGLDDSDIQDDETTLASKLAHPDDGYSRSQLKAAAETLREDADDITLSSSKNEFAEWLAGHAEGEDAEMSQAELREVITGGGD